MINSIPCVILSLLLYPVTSGAGELSQLTDGPRYALSLQDTEGRQRTLDEFRGQVLMIHFWASWCTPCIQEMPGLLHLRDAMRGYPLTVVGINVGETELRAKTAARRLGLDFPVLLDRDSRIFEAWSLGVLPSTYILDGNGQARYLVRGPMDWERDDILNTLKDLAQPSPGVSSANRQPHH